VLHRSMVMFSPFNPITITWWIFPMVSHEAEWPDLTWARLLKGDSESSFWSAEWSQCYFGGWALSSDDSPERSSVGIRSETKLCTSPSWLHVSENQTCKIYKIFQMAFIRLVHEALNYCF
jgi:hypothetical protein